MGPIFLKSYKFFRACLIKFSTEAFGVSLIILSITFSAVFLTNPKTSKADNASSLFVLLSTLHCFLFTILPKVELLPKTKLFQHVPQGM
jgi:hypothetical protein